MNTNHIERHFAAMGARFKLTREAKFPRAGFQDYAMDIDHDSRGAFFALRVPEALDASLDVTVMQSEKHDRHLLLLVRKGEGGKTVKDRFLCGHDERHWFVAAVPGGASSVSQAKEALKPVPVRQAQAQSGLNHTQRNSRKNRAFRRQGEWFFVEEPGLVVDPKLILHNEPISRGNGKPHVIAEVFRTGGETEEGKVCHGARLRLRVHEDAVPGVQRDDFVVGMANSSAGVDAAANFPGVVQQQRHSAQNGDSAGATPVAGTIFLLECRL